MKWALYLFLMTGAPAGDGSAAGVYDTKVQCVQVLRTYQVYMPGIRGQCVPTWEI